MIVRGVILLALIFSVGVCFVQPKMHNTFEIYDSQYEIVDNVSVVEDKNAISVTPIIKEEKNIVPVKPVVQEEKKIIPSTQKTEQKTKTVQQPVNTKKTETKKEEKVVQKEVKKTQPVKETNKKVEVAKPVVTQQEILEREEIIAWNKWHSELQNSIMRDTKMPPVPDGTIFNFTFTVDKYGKISNIKVWSNNSGYNVYAIQYIAPVIRGYQGKSILNFLKNSQRMVTQFVGKFKIVTSGENKYSTEKDFNDSEKIRKY